MNQPSEDYPKYFPYVIPPPPPPGFFSIPPPPDFSTIVPPIEKPKSNGALIALLVIVLAIILVGIFFLLYKWWKKDVKESQQQVEKHEPNRVRSSKNGRKSNVHESDMVYRCDRRLSKSNGRLMEASYDYDYEGDLESGFYMYSTVESGFDDMYSTSGDESNFFLGDLVIDAKDVRKSNAYKGEENTSSKPQTTHNGQTKEENTSSKPETTHNGQTKKELAEDAGITNDIEPSILLIRDKVDTKSNASEGEEDVHSETETIHDRQSEQKLAKDSMRSDAPQSDLESALGETGPSKSEREKVRPGTGRKKRVQGRGG